MNCTIHAKHRAVSSLMSVQEYNDMYTTVHHDKTLWRRQKKKVSRRLSLNVVKGLDGTILTSRLNAQRIEEEKVENEIRREANRRCRAAMVDACSEVKLAVGHFNPIRDDLPLEEGESTRMQVQRVFVMHGGEKVFLYDDFPHNAGRNDIYWNTERYATICNTLTSLCFVASNNEELPN